MKIFYSFLVSTLILLSTSLSVGATTDLPIDGHSETEHVDCNCDISLMYDAICLYSQSGKHEMKADGGVGTFTVLNKKTNANPFTKNNLQLWKCRACGEFLITEFEAWATSFGKYLTGAELEVKSSAGHKIFLTNKTYSTMSYTSNRVIPGYMFF